MPRDAQHSIHRFGEETNAIRISGSGVGESTGARSERAWQLNCNVD